MTIKIEAVMIVPIIILTIFLPDISFEALVRNEWRIETCFEGWRFINLRRWGATTAELNVPVHGIQISADGTITHPVVETRNFPSEWMPIPYYDMRRCGNLVQNAGWESWK